MTHGVPKWTPQGGPWREKSVGEIWRDLAGSDTILVGSARQREG